MTTRFVRALRLALPLALLGSLALPAPSATALEPADRAEIETIIREYLIANPEVLLEAQRAYQTKQEAQRALAQAAALASNKEKILSADGQITVGPADAPITVVEFFDYNCGFCSRALDDMQKLVQDGNKVRFILREFPVLGPDSNEAHKVSIAFTRLMPEKAAEFHVKLLSTEGHKTGQMALDVAESFGADRAALEAAMKEPGIEDSIRESYRLADALSITGTPSYVIGDEVVFGAVGYEALAGKIEAMETCGKTSC